MKKQQGRTVRTNTRKTTRVTDLAPKAARGSSVKAGAFNAFRNFGDIKGESTDVDHKDWITVLS